MTIEFRSVSFSYRPGSPVLRDISFTLSSGGFLLLIGQNGAGKSTLLKLLNGILRPTSGQIVVGEMETSGRSTAELAAQVCVTFQNPADQIFASTVRGEVEFAPRNLERTDRDSLVAEALSLCELDLLASSHPYDLPPAQRKLLTVASAIASGSPLLAFDEPSAGLSQIEQRQLSHVVTRLREKGRGFLVVSHDLELFLPFADRVILLHAGRVKFDGTAGELLLRERLLREAGLRLPKPMRLNNLLERVGS